MLERPPRVKDLFFHYFTFASVALDRVFLPRPLYLVNSLPRNAVGKLPRETLLQLAAACAASSKIP